MESNEDVCKKLVARQKKRRKRERLIKRIILIFVIGLLLVVVGVGIVFGIKAMSNNSYKKTTTSGNITKNDNKNKEKSEDSKKTKKSDKDIKEDADKDGNNEIDDTDEENKDEDNGEDAKADFQKFKKVKRPTKGADYKDIFTPDILSPYVALIDVNNNSVIAGKSTDTKIYPASMTKVMTLIVAVENLKSLDDSIEMTADIIDPLVREQASRAGFEPGERASAKDMLYGLILPSGADCSVGLGKLICGSEEGLVELMNKKCEELGLTGTHFTNTSGLHNENHYTTPVEMAMILEYAMTNETCAEVLSTYQYTTAPSEIHPEGILLTSTMFSRMYGDEVNTVTINGGKTGYTNEARNCLVSMATRGDDKYIAVTAGGGNRWHVIFDDFNLYGNYIPNPPGYEKNGEIPAADDGEGSE